MTSLQKGYRKRLEKGQSKLISHLCQAVSANYNSKFKQLSINKILLSKRPAEDSRFLPTGIPTHIFCIFFPPLIKLSVMY